MAAEATRSHARLGVRKWNGSCTYCQLSESALVMSTDYVHFYLSIHIEL